MADLIITQGITETLASANANAVVTQAVIETLASANANAVITQAVIETLASANANAVLTQSLIETLASETVNVYVTRTAVEIASQANADIRVTRTAIEILRQSSLRFTTNAASITLIVPEVVSAISIVTENNLLTISAPNVDAGLSSIFANQHNEIIVTGPVITAGLAILTDTALVNVNAIDATILTQVNTFLNVDTCNIEITAPDSLLKIENQFAVESANITLAVSNAAIGFGASVEPATINISPENIFVIKNEIFDVASTNLSINASVISVSFTINVSANEVVLTANPVTVVQTGILQISQVAVEVFGNTAANLEISQVAIEVLVPSKFNIEESTSNTDILLNSPVVTFLATPPLTGINANTNIITIVVDTPVVNTCTYYAVSPELPNLLTGYEPLLIWANTINNLIEYVQVLPIYEHSYLLGFCHPPIEKFEIPNLLTGVEPILYWGNTVNQLINLANGISTYTKDNYSEPMVLPAWVSGVEPLLHLANTINELILYVNALATDILICGCEAGFSLDPAFIFLSAATTSVVQTGPPIEPSTPLICYDFTTATPPLFTGGTDDGKYWQHPDFWPPDAESYPGPEEQFPDLLIADHVRMLDGKLTYTTVVPSDPLEDEPWIVAAALFGGTPVQALSSSQVLTSGEIVRVTSAENKTIILRATITMDPEIYETEIGVSGTLLTGLGISFYSVAPQLVAYDIVEENQIELWLIWRDGDTGSPKSALAKTYPRDEWIGNTYTFTIKITPGTFNYTYDENLPNNTSRNLVNDKVNFDGSIKLYESDELLYEVTDSNIIFSRDVLVARRTRKELYHVGGFGVGFYGLMGSYSDLCLSYQDTSELPKGPTHAYAVGGVMAYSGTHSDLFTFSTETFAAQTLSSLSTQRKRLMAVTDVGRLYGYVLGGQIGSTLQTTTDRITYATHVAAAQSSSNLQTAQSGAASLSSEQVDRGFVIGGQSAFNTATTAAQQISFSTGSVSTQTNAALKSSTSGFRLYVTGISSGTNKGYVVGVNDNYPTDATNRILYSTMISAAVTSMQLSTPRYTSAGISDSSNYGYVLGGYRPASFTYGMTTCDRLTFATEVLAAWTPGNLATGRDFVSGFSGEDYGYVSGGYSSSGGILNSTDRLTFSTGVTASSTSSLTEGRTEHASFSNYAI